MISGVASQPDVPERLIQAIEAAKESRTGPEAARQAAVVAGLRAGHPSEISVSDLQQLNTGLLEPLDTVMRDP